MIGTLLKKAVVTYFKILRQTLFGDKVVSVLKNHAVKTYAEVEVKSHVFVTSALGRIEWTASRSGLFISK
jgi:hypothetical protein